MKTRVAAGATPGHERWSRRLGLLAAVLILQGCDTLLGGNACTLVGCDSGLRVIVQGSPTSPYRIEVGIESSPARFVYQCPTSSACEWVFFPHYTPETPTVRVITGADTVVVRERVEYTRHQPNGPDCGPTCLTGTVVVNVPAPTGPAARTH